MNTAQLTVLWYAGLLIIAILLFQAADKDSAYLLIAAITLFTLLLLYTLKPHPQARKRWVLGWVLSPFLIAGLGLFGWYGYDQYKDRLAARLIPNDQIELENMDLLRSEYDYRRDLKGRVTNHSPHRLTRLYVEIPFEAAGCSDKRTADFDLYVNPGESRLINESVYISDSPCRFIVISDIKVVGTRGEVVPGSQ